MSCFSSISFISSIKVLRYAEAGCWLELGGSWAARQVELESLAPVRSTRRLRPVAASSRPVDAGGRSDNVEVIGTTNFLISRHFRSSRREFFVFGGISFPAPSPAPASERSRRSAHRALPPPSPWTRSGQLRSADDQKHPVTPVTGAADWWLEQRRSAAGLSPLGMGRTGFLMVAPRARADAASNMPPSRRQGGIEETNRLLRMFRLLRLSARVSWLLRWIHGARYP